MNEKKYLAVYGTGVTIVVGRVIESWRDENVKSETFGMMFTKKPEKDLNKWTRHLVLQDLTGGLNYIAPYPDTTMNINPNTLHNAVPENVARQMLQETAGGELHVLKHTTGELPYVEPLKKYGKRTTDPSIEKQLLYGEEKAKILTRSNKNVPVMESEWKWTGRDGFSDLGVAFPPGMGATIPTGSPIIPIIVTDIKKDKKGIAVTGVNPVDWKQEHFRLKTDDGEREYRRLSETKGSVRMFFPQKYIRGQMSEAKIIHSEESEERNAREEMFRLENAYRNALARASEYDRAGKRISLQTMNALEYAGMSLFRTRGFMETAEVTERIMALYPEHAEKQKFFSSCIDKARKLTEKKEPYIHVNEIRNIIAGINTVWRWLNIKNIVPGRYNWMEKTSFSQEKETRERCSALLKAVQEYGAGHCYINPEKKALMWNMAGSTFEKSSPEPPDRVDEKHLFSLTVKHLNSLHDRDDKHLYMEGRSATVIINVPDEAESREDEAKRLAEGLRKNEREYDRTRSDGTKCIPLYRRGHTRRIPGTDIRVQVRATIADTWVLPGTSRKYVKGMSEWMKKNGIRIPELEEGKDGINAARLTKAILDEAGKATVEERLSLLHEMTGTISAKERKDREAQKKVAPKP